MADKLNSMRLLDQRKIDYTIRDFPDNIHSGVGVAEYLGLPPEMVYKTLVLLPTTGKPILVMVPGDEELNLKKVARSVDQKKVQMASHREAESLTGLQTGGISALALLHKNFPVYIDQSALNQEKILVSAGKRGINLELSVRDLIKITHAKTIEAV